MYAHQVISKNLELLKVINEKYPEVSRIKEDNKLATFYLTMLASINKIKNCHKFHADSYINLESAFPSLDGKALMMHNYKYLRLPYKTCWFDYVVDLDDKECLDPGQEIMRKRGILAQQIFKDFIYVDIYAYRDLKEGRRDLFNSGWSIGFYSYLISIGKQFKERADIKKIEGMFPGLSHSRSDGNLQTIPMLGADIGKEQRLIIADEDATDIKLLEMYLMLLNCKNIIREEVPAPKKLNKKRIKNNKVELFTYYTLKIKPTGPKAGTAGLKPEDLRRIHFCRGHFKEYTKKNPLFGKHTGLYWWQPHVRGSSKKGIVMKDYEI